MFERMKMGLALGAGGARGLAHIGVLKALERAGIPICCIAGSSIGAMVGAAYAVRGSAAEVENLFADFLETDLYRETGVTTIRDAMVEKPDSLPQRLETWLKKAYLQARIVSRPHLIDSALFRQVIEHFIPNVLIENLPLPFRAVGTDIKSGRPVVFSKGPLRAAVYASAAIPGVISGLSLNDMIIVDGGVLSTVPTRVTRGLGADLVLAVDVDKPLEHDKVEFSSGIDVFFRIEDVQGAYLKSLELRDADLVLHPNVGQLHWSNFERLPELVRLGSDEVEKHLEEIRFLAGRRRWPWLRRGSSAPDGEWVEV